MKSYEAKPTMVVKESASQWARIDQPWGQKRESQPWNKKSGELVVVAISINDGVNES